MIDNYDSFTYNLVQYFGELGQEVRVFRNDAIPFPRSLASSRRFPGHLSGPVCAGTGRHLAGGDSRVCRQDSPARRVPRSSGDR
ncbi:MAG: hypothetical protein V5B44_25930 [Candidatus Accumulibacter necessarius]|uniref:glutamine amidotransferase-related protein n=1 Tax=Candidatus Accumulibacter necessarius TaxID=2954386 RepID=UPI002FC33127